MFGCVGSARRQPFHLNPCVCQVDSTAGARQFECLFELRNDIGRIFADGINQDREGVAQAFDPSSIKNRCVAKGRQSGSQSHQVAHEVPAVHRRDIERDERQSRLGVVPVIEVASMALQRFHCPECVRRAHDESSGRHVTEVVRR